MTVLLYAITDGDGRSAPAAGVQDRPVRAVAASGLTALVSEHDRVPALDADAAWSFERVVESALGSAAVVPARFGTAFADLTALSHTLRTRNRDLTDALHRVRGRVELSVRVVESAGGETCEADGVAHTGRDYMRGRLALVRRARAIAARVSAELDANAVASRYRLLARPAVPVTASFLVGAGNTAEFVQRVDGLGGGLDELDVVCTGPWPAYSFVGGDHV